MRNQPYGQLGLAPVPFYFTLRRLDAEEDNISRSLGWRLIDYTATDEVFHTYIYNTTLQDFDQWLIIATFLLCFVLLDVNLYQSNIKYE